MTTTQKIRNKAEAVLEKARADYQEVNDKIVSYTEEMEKAAAEMETAGDNMDLTAFNTAREKQFQAESAIRMYQTRKDKLEVSPLVSEEEYQSLCGSIMDDADKRREEMRVKLYDLAGQIVKLYDEYSGAIQEYDEVLHLLQYDLYKAYDLPRNNSGQIVGSDKGVNRRQAFEYLTWIGDPARECYKAMMTAGIGGDHE